MTRAELYALIWDQPFTQVARKVGVSDARLRRICADYQIPLPPPGYWSKRTHNKSAEPPPLPEFGSSLLTRINTAVKRLGGMPLQIASSQLDAFNLKLPLPPDDATKAKQVHAGQALVSALGEQLRRRKADAEGFVVLRDAKFPTVRVAQNNVERTLSLFDSLLTALGEAGYSAGETVDGFRLLADGESFSLAFYETRQKQPLRAGATRFAEAYGPSGKLCMEIVDTRPMRWTESNRVGLWYDRRGRPVERYIAVALKAIAGYVVVIKQVRAALDTDRHVEKDQSTSAALRDLSRKEQSFLLDKAETFAQLQRLAALADFYAAEADTDADEPENLMARALRKLVADLRSQLDGRAVRAELVKLGLFADKK